MLWAWSLGLLVFVLILSHGWELSRLHHDTRIPKAWDDDSRRTSSRLRVLLGLLGALGALAAVTTRPHDRPWETLLPITVALPVAVPIVSWLHARHNRRFPRPSR